MNRSRKGRSITEAVEHWTDPDNYAAVFDHQPGRERTEIESLHIEQTRIDLDRYLRAGEIKGLYDDLFKRLADGSLLSSAIDDAADPSHPRSAVHPSLYDGPVSYDGHRDLVVAQGRTLRNVEVFETDDIPANLTRLPEWFGQYSSHSEDTGRKPSSLASDDPAFRHDQGYRHVSIRGTDFALSMMQAKVVRMLHHASADAQDAWVNLKDLRDGAGFDSNKLSQLFRRQPNWRELIESDGHGFYRLKL